MKNQLAFAALLACLATSTPSLADTSPTPYDPGFTGKVDLNSAALREQSSLSGFPVGPQFTPSVPQLLAAYTSISEKGSTIKLTLAPLRAFSIEKHRWLWGIGLSAAFESDKKITTLGLSYRFNWQWLFKSAYSRLFPIIKKEAQIDFTKSRGSEGSVWSDSINRLREDNKNQSAKVEKWRTEEAQLKAELVGLNFMLLVEREVKGTVDSSSVGDNAGPTAQRRLSVIEARIAGRKDAIAARLTALSTLISNAERQYNENKRNIDTLERNLEKHISDYDALLVRRLDFSRFRLTPALIIDYAVGLFQVDLKGDHPESIASHSVSAKFLWQFGPYFNLDGSVAFSLQRNSIEAGSIMAKSIGLSITALVRIPHVFNTVYYDDVYKKTGIQRGLGLGASLGYKKCFEKDDNRQTCPDQITSELFIGGIIAFTVSDTISPQLVLGWTKRDVYKLGEAGEQNGISASAVLSIALSK